MQLYRKVPQIEAGWNTYAIDNDIFSQCKRPDDDAEMVDVADVAQLVADTIAPDDGDGGADDTRGR